MSTVADSGTGDSTAGIPPSIRLAAALLSIPSILVINVIARKVTDAETATLIAGGIPGTALTVMEYVNAKRQPRRERIRRAVERTYHRTPLLVVAYVVVALQTIQGLIGFLVGLGVGAALAPYSPTPEQSSSIAVSTAAVVIVPLVAIALVFVARAAAYRIKDHRFAWLLLALLINVGLNLVSTLAIIGRDEFVLSSTEVVGLVVVNALYVGTIMIAVRWAERTEELHILARAYRNLSRDEQVALVDLALPRVPAAEGVSDLSR